MSFFDSTFVARKKIEVLALKRRPLPKRILFPQIIGVFSYLRCCEIVVFRARLLPIFFFYGLALTFGGCLKRSLDLQGIAASSIKLNQGGRLCMKGHFLNQKGEPNKITL